MLVGMRTAATHSFVMQRPDEQKPADGPFPNGTTFGGASGQSGKYARPARGRLEQ